MSDNNHTVQPIINGAEESEIISTLNHNFQVITERIKELNINISYLDLLKINQIFTVDSSQYPRSGEQAKKDANLQNFVSSCWNILSNYAGVYIQCTEGSNPLFTWMNEYEVCSGDFIVKLPNNQSLYLPGQKPKTMVPTSWTNGVITYTPADQATQPTSVPLGFGANIESAYQGIRTVYVSGATIPSLDSINSYASIRYYRSDTGEEILLGNETTSVTVPIAVTAIGIYKNN